MGLGLPSESESETETTSMLGDIAEAYGVLFANLQRSVAVIRKTTH